MKDFKKVRTINDKFELTAKSTLASQVKSFYPYLTDLIYQTNQLYSHILDKHHIYGRTHI